MAVTIQIEDLYIEKVVFEFVRPLKGENYVQLTIDYSLLNENKEPILRKGIVRYGPNSGLPAELLIDRNLAMGLEQIILQAGRGYKVVEGLLPPEEMAAPDGLRMPEGVLYWADKTKYSEATA